MSDIDPPIAVKAGRLGVRREPKRFRRMNGKQLPGKPQMRAGGSMAAISVTYEKVAGTHMFWSEDVRGLCVASKDLALAYEDVSAQIGILLGYKVKPSVPFQKFEAWLASSTPAPEHVTPAAHIAWRAMQDA